MHWLFLVFLCLAAATAAGEVRIGDVDAYTPVSGVVREGLATPVENVFVGKDAGAGSKGLTNVVVVGRDSGQDATGLENVFALGDNALRSDSSLRNCLFVGDNIGPDEMSGVTNCLMVMGRDGDYGALDAGTSGLVRFFGAFDVWESGIWHIGRNAAWLQGIPGDDVDSAALQFGVDFGGSLRYDVSTNMSTLRVGWKAAVGDNGIAVGYNAEAVGSGVSAGYKAKGAAAGDVAIGASAHARGEVENPKGVGAVAVGGNATAVSGSDNYGGSTAVGFNASAGDTCLAVGSGAAAGSIKWKSNTSRCATAIGADAKATHPGSTVLGSYWSDAIGESDVKSQGPLTLSVAAPDPAYFYFGAASRDADGNAITPRSLDWYLRWRGTPDIAMGPDAITTTNSVVIGGEASVGGSGSVAVGSSSGGDGGVYCVSVGASAQCSTTRDAAGYGTAVGFASEAYGENATALGASAHADSRGTAVGAWAKAYANGAMAIGTFAYAGIADSLAFPTDAEHTYFNSVVSNKGATAVSLRTYLDAKADATNVYSKSDIDGKGYLTAHQSLDDYAKTTTLNSYSNELATAISNATPDDYAAVRSKAESALQSESDPVFAAWTNRTSFTLGNAAKTGDSNGTAVGAFSTAGYNAAAFGYGAKAAGQNSLALGYDSYAPNASSMGLTFTPEKIYLGAVKDKSAGRTLQSYLDERATTDALAEVKASIPVISATDAAFSSAVNAAARALVKAKLESLDRAKSSIGDTIAALQSIYEETK